jgi:hypothetical protein
VGEIYMRKYPMFQIIAVKLKRAKALFNLFFLPLDKIKINKRKFSVAAVKGNIA